jgi:drug/metabolite transporter (DMT)-like permease
LIINRDFDVTVPLILYSFAFSVAYAAATVCMILAIRYGSLAKTSLVISYSLLIPTLYGIIVLGDPLGIFKIIGFVLLVVSLFLTNYTPKFAETSVANDTQKKKSSLLLWLIFLVISFVGNGMCSTIQKMEQVALEENAQANLFMVIALAINTVFMFIMALITEKPKEVAVVCKKTWWIAAICGIFNGLTNFLVLVLNGKLPASVLFPVISAGGIVFIFLYSMIVYRERFKPMQIVGFALGVGSIVLLNL